MAAEVAEHFECGGIIFENRFAVLNDGEVLGVDAQGGETRAGGVHFADGGDGNCSIRESDFGGWNEGREFALDGGKVDGRLLDFEFWNRKRSEGDVAGGVEVHRWLFGTGGFEIEGGVADVF